MLLYFDVGGTQIVFILHLVIFSLSYLTTLDVERRLPIGSLSSRMTFMGAPPPSLDDIKTEPKSVKLFFNALFVHRTHISHKTKFKSILAATVLRFHRSFLEVIGN